MATELQPADLKRYERALDDRFAALRSEIREALQRSDDETYASIAGLVHDAEDQAVADLLVDVNIAEVNRDIDELRDIDAARRRIALGVYGECIDCGAPIAQARLDAYPTAKRCERCQRLRERTRMAPPTPRL